MWEAARRGDRLIDLNLLADAGMPWVFEMVQQLLDARRGGRPPGPVADRAAQPGGTRMAPLVAARA